MPTCIIFLYIAVWLLVNLHGCSWTSKICLLRYFLHQLFFNISISISAVSKVLDMCTYLNVRFSHDCKRSSQFDWFSCENLCQVCFIHEYAFLKAWQETRYTGLTHVFYVRYKWRTREKMCVLLEHVRNKPKK